MNEIILAANQVTIDLRRWNIRIIVDRPEGRAEFIASADSAFTGNSGIWFGTLAEYEQAVADL